VLRRSHWIAVLYGLWAMLFIASTLVTAQTAPTGDGFLRGANRIWIFLKFQGGATVVAVVIWRMGRHLPNGWQRWLARLPVLFALGIVLLIVGLVAVASLERPCTQSTSPAMRSTTLPIR